MEGVSGNQEPRNKLRGSCPLLPSRNPNWREGSFNNRVFQPFAWDLHQFHSLARSPGDILSGQCGTVVKNMGLCPGQTAQLVRALPLSTMVVSSIP